MVDPEGAATEETGGLFPQSVGERLRAARLAALLDLNDVATRTRVPMRHLEALERGDYSALPSPTYAVGFARSFARAIGADEGEIARDLRAELGRAPPEDADSEPYQPVDPARLPSRLLAWTAALLFVVVLGGYLAWRAQLFDAAPAIEPPPVAEAPLEAAPPAAAPVAAPTTGTVVLTATDTTWLRIYDKADKVLLQKELAPGESYTVPADADTPMIRTGRPEAIKVTVDGREVAPLGPPERTVRDVVLTAAALAARPAVSATPPAASDRALPSVDAPANMAAPGLIRP